MSNIRLGIVEVVGVRVVAQDNKGGRFYRNSGSRDDAPFSYSKQICCRYSKAPNDLSINADQNHGTNSSVSALAKTMPTLNREHDRKVQQALVARRS